MTHVNVFVLFDRILQVQVVIADVMPANRKLLVTLATPFYFWRRKSFHGAFEFRDLLCECRDFWFRRNRELGLGCERETFQCQCIRSEPCLNYKAYKGARINQQNNFWLESSILQNKGIE